MYILINFFGIDGSYIRIGVHSYGIDSFIKFNQWFYLVSYCLFSGTLDTAYRQFGPLRFDLWCSKFSISLGYWRELPCSNEILKLSLFRRLGALKDVHDFFRGRYWLFEFNEGFSTILFEWIGQYFLGAWYLLLLIYPSFRSIWRIFFLNRLQRKVFFDTPLLGFEIYWRSQHLIRLVQSLFFFYFF